MNVLLLSGMNSQVQWMGYSGHYRRFKKVWMESRSQTDLLILTNFPARKQELRETVETHQTQLSDLRKQLKAAEDTSTTSQAEVDTLKQTLDRALPFEKEVKEKNLLIGKLRHEAVILNDHLTKALKYIKRSKPDDTVDKYALPHHLPNPQTPKPNMRSSD